MYKNCLSVTSIYNLQQIPHNILHLTKTKMYRKVKYIFYEHLKFDIGFIQLLINKLT